MSSVAVALLAAMLYVNLERVAKLANADGRQRDVKRTSIGVACVVAA